MIQHLKRNQINIKKYDACIESSINSLIYAYSWYLDIVADNWDVLVLGDYEAVMPIPFMRSKRNLFLKKIIQPPFCQQLGIFNTRQLTKLELIDLLEKFKLLNPINYNFNSDNHFKKFLKLTKRVNFELNLNLNFVDIKKNYSKNLIRNIKKSSKNNLLLVNNISISDIILMKKENKKHSISCKQFKIMKKLLTELSNRNYGRIYGVKIEETLIGSAFIVKTNLRIIHLLSAVNQVGKDKNAIPHLFNELIKDNSSNKMIFDFEGSMIPNIARFFSSFGAKQNYYYSYSKL